MRRRVLASIFILAAILVANQYGGSFLAQSAPAPAPEQAKDDFLSRTEAPSDPEPPWHSGEARSTHPSPELEAIRALDKVREQELSGSPPDICALNNGPWHRLSTSSIVKSLGDMKPQMPAGCPSDSLWALLAADSPAAAEAALRGQNDPMLRFFRAAYLGGFLSQMAEPNDPPPMDLAAARKILHDLAQEQPDNAAFPYYLIGVEQKMGLPNSELRARLLQMLGGKFFQSYDAKLYHCVFLALEQKPHLLRPITTAFHHSSGANWGVPAKKVRELLFAYPELAHPMRTLAERFRQKAQRNLPFRSALYSLDLHHHLALFMDRILALLEKRDVGPLPKVSTEPQWQLSALDSLGDQAFPTSRECEPTIALAWMRSIQESIREWQMQVGY